MPLLQDTGSQLFYCLLSTLSISIESILYLLNLPCLTSASLVRRESGATAKLSPVMDVESVPHTLWCNREDIVSITRF